MGKKKEASLRLVLDTNVIVSSLLFGRELSRIVELWKTGKIIPLFTRETFAELRNVLTYPKFELTEAEMKCLIEEEILPFCEVVTVLEKVHPICKDPDDDKFIDCAVAGSARHVVTGDKIFLKTGKYRGVSIVSVRTLLGMFRF